jgi:hypothetical protein
LPPPLLAGPLAREQAEAPQWARRQAPLESLEPALE